MWSMLAAAWRDAKGQKQQLRAEGQLYHFHLVKTIPRLLGEAQLLPGSKELVKLVPVFPLSFVPRSREGVRILSEV